MNYKVDDKIKNILKPELHRHIEGCVRTETIIDIARKYNLKIPTFDLPELEKIYKVYEPGESLDKILDMFYLAQNSFYSYDEVERITYEALIDAYEKENIRLIELRYSPDFMLGKRDLDWQKSLDIINSVMSRFEKTHNMLCGVIIIFSRSYGLKSALKTADFAILNKKKIIGFDLADSETAYPAESYKNIAARLHKENVNLTVHSGEDSDYSQMSETIKILNPQRIGHGVKAANDPKGKTVNLVKERGIALETNPWSNYLTGAVKSVEKHPLKHFINAGVKCSIGSDDPQILNTDLNKEYSVCAEHMGLDFNDINYCINCALQTSFLPIDKKQQAAIELKLH